MKIKGIMVVEDIDCQACKGTGYAPGHEPTEPGVPYRWCSTCQGQKVRQRLMSLDDFVKVIDAFTKELTCPACGRGADSIMRCDTCKRGIPLPSESVPCAECGRACPSQPETHYKSQRYCGVECAFAAAQRIKETRTVQDAIDEIKEVADERERSSDVQLKPLKTGDLVDIIDGTHAGERGRIIAFARLSEIGVKMFQVHVIGIRTREVREDFMRHAEDQGPKEASTGLAPNEAPYALPWCTHYPKHYVPAVCDSLRPNEAPQTTLAKVTAIVDELPFQVPPDVWTRIAAVLDEARAIDGRQRTDSPAPHKHDYRLVYTCWTCREIEPRHCPPPRTEPARCDESSLVAAVDTFLLRAAFEEADMLDPRNSWLYENAIELRQVVEACAQHRNQARSDEGPVLVAIRAYRRMVEQTDRHPDALMAAWANVCGTIDALPAQRCPNEAKNDGHLTSLDIVFDGAPGMPAPRFVELEVGGKSVGIGRWSKRTDGLWMLSVACYLPDAPPRSKP